MFFVIAKASTSIYGQIGTIYLTNDLGYSKENLSLVKIICTPVNIFLAVISGYLGNNNAFAYTYYLLIALCIVSSYAVLVLIGTMPTDKAEQNTLFVYLHVSALTFVLDLLDELLQTLTFGILMARTDKRVSALHVTVLASLLNMTGFIHKVYIFWLVEKFGIYYP